MASGTSSAAGKATGPQSPDAIGGSPQMHLHAEDVSNPQDSQMREGDVQDPQETQTREGEPQSMPERQEEAMLQDQPLQDTQVGTQPVAIDPQESPQIPEREATLSPRPSRITPTGVNPVIPHPELQSQGEDPATDQPGGIPLRRDPNYAEIIWVDVPTNDTMTLVQPRQKDDLPAHIKGRAQWGKSERLPADASHPQPPPQKAARLLGEEVTPTRTEGDRPNTYYLRMKYCDLPIEYVNATTWYRLYWQADQGQYALDGNGQIAAYQHGLGTSAQPTRR